MMLDVTENKYFNVYTSIVSMIQFLYTIIHTISIHVVIYDTCICTRSSHIMMLIKVFPKFVLATDEHVICTPFIKGDNTHHTQVLYSKRKSSFFSKVTIDLQYKSDHALRLRCSYLNNILR